MRLGALLPHLGDTDPLELAIAAEEWGYDSVWLGELWGRSSVVTLTEIASHTEAIGIGTAITNVYSRSPATLAMTAATLDDVAEGRFTLGLGTSTQKAIEDLHGMDFARPVRRAHEAIELLQCFTSGESDRVRYDGEIFSVADFPPIDADVPIYHAALGPANRRVVGRLCDGWLPHNIPFTDLDDAFEEIATAARERGRDPEAITVAPYVPAAVADEPAVAERAIKSHVAYYIGSAAGYRNAVGARFLKESEAIASAWGEGDREAAAEAVTEEMVGTLGVCGTPEEARTQLEALYEETAIDYPLVIVPQQAADDLAAGTLEALAPLATGD